MSFHDPHHSFSIGLAEQYGVMEAIFIHHFQHWIRVNMRLKRNFHDGKTWTYQSIEVFQAHFSYLTYKQVRTILDSLVKQGVIVKGNYNKMKTDKTCWYAFADESFTCNLSGICPKGQMDVPEKADGCARKGAPIPDDLTDDKTDESLSLSHSEASKESVSDLREIDLSSKLFEKIKQINPSKKALSKSERDNWGLEIFQMMKEDGRSFEQIEQAIDWFATDPFWMKRIHNAVHLRKHFETMYPQMNPVKSKGDINRELVLNTIKQYPNDYIIKNLKVTKTYVLDPKSQKDLMFANHTPEQFKALFMAMIDAEEE